MNATASYPRLTTERLLLRLPDVADLDSYAAYNRTARSHWTGGPRNEDDSFRHLASQIGHWQFRGFGMFAVVKKGQAAAMALVGLWKPPAWPETEMGWLIFSDADEGKGYAAEAALAVRNWAFRELGLTTLVSYIHPENAASIALARRIGATDDTSDSPGLAKYPDTLIYRHPSPEALA